VQFFIPHLRDDPVAAEAEPQRYLRESPAPASSRRVYLITYEHNGDKKYDVAVDKPRKQYRRRAGLRGGYIKNAGHQP
jgi:hypothetical protein